MRRPPDPATLYLVNASLLVTHEIDSAFQREWELFRMPGGIGLFLVLNLVLVVAVLAGYRSVLLRRDSARVWSWLLVAAGAIAVAVHGSFLAAGDTAFRSPASLLVLAAWGAGSAAQAVATAAAGRAGRHGRDRAAEA